MKLNQRISTFLMFQKSDAKEAMEFYVSLFPESEIHSIEYWPDSEAPEEEIKTAEFSLMGQKFMCMDSPIPHAFDFTPSTSIFINCKDEAEIQKLYTQLSQDGQVLMELMDHGFSRKFCWVNDRFGVSWQLNLP